MNEQKSRSKCLLRFSFVPSFLSESHPSCRPTASVTRHPSAAAALGAPVARREVGLVSYPSGLTATIGSFDRRLRPACTASGYSGATDHAERSRCDESPRPTSGHGVRRRALRPLSSGTTAAFSGSLTADRLPLDSIFNQTTGAGGTERGAPLGAQASAVSIAFRRAPSGAAR